MSDHAALVKLARDRRTRAQAYDHDYSAATLRAIELAVGDVDSTGRPATDEELAAVTRALIGDLR